MHLHHAILALHIVVFLPPSLFSLLPYPPSLPLFFPSYFLAYVLPPSLPSFVTLCLPYLLPSLPFFYLLPSSPSSVISSLPSPSLPSSPSFLPSFSPSLLHPPFFTFFLPLFRPSFLPYFPHVLLPVSLPSSLIFNCFLIPFDLSSSFPSIFLLPPPSLSHLIYHLPSTSLIFCHFSLFLLIHLRHLSFFYSPFLAPSLFLTHFLLFLHLHIFFTHSSFFLIPSFLPFSSSYVL